MKDRTKFRPRGTGSIFRQGSVLWIRYYRNGKDSARAQALTL